MDMSRTTRWIASVAATLAALPAGYAASVMLCDYSAFGTLLAALPGDSCADVVDHHGGALGCQEKSLGAPDAPTGARDHRDLAVQHSHASIPFP